MFDGLNLIVDFGGTSVGSAVLLGELFSPDGWLNVWGGGVLLLVAASLLLFSILLWLIHRRDRRLFEALSESTTQQQTLISNLPGVAFRCCDDADGTVMFISDEIERLTGYPPSAFSEQQIMRFKDLLHPDDRDPVLEAMRHETTSGKPFELDFRLCHADGTVIWVHAKGRGGSDLHKRTRWIDGVLIDVTERHQMEAERERLSTAIEQADEIIVIADAGGIMLYVNPAFERITGYSRAEAIGTRPSILKSGRHDDAFYLDMWETLKHGKVWKGRIVNKRKDGSLYTEEVNITPVRDARGEIVNYVAVKRDITNELELEEQRRQAQKMESVARLAGGVAHGFNNLLQAILGHTEIAISLIDVDDKLFEDLQGIRDATQRSTELTRQLLAFARKQTINPEVLDLNQTIANTVKALPQMIGNNIGLVWRPSKNLWKVAMDPVQLDQALVALCRNARDAIGDSSGKITIATSNMHVSIAGAVGSADMNPGDYVVLSVGDDGCGMDETIMAHAFEPFFTTKKMGRGTGMGLATIYGIVQQNHGHIDVESKPGEGSTFTIYLPRLFIAEREETQAVPAAPVSRPATETPTTILLVEDEVAALNVCKIMLDQGGYRVVAAQSAAEALRLADENAGDIDLLLTDVVMPDMNGYELAQRLLHDYPGLRCLFMSGYTADIIARQGVVEEGILFIQKPFAMAGLLAKVKTALSQEPSVLA